MSLVDCIAVRHLFTMLDLTV